MLKKQTRSSSIKAWTIMGCMALVLALPDWAAAQAPFKRIVVFGTSLSDPGNAFVFVGGRNTPRDYSLDDNLIPDKPYARGGHHFSNGATWIEQLARPLGLAGSTRPAFRNPGGGASNYAVGGARARAEGPFNLSQQVGAFLQDVGGVAPPDALYVIEMGGNDLRDGLVRLSQQPPDFTGANFILGAALASIGDSIVDLYAAGARKFLVWNAPNIGLTPAIRGLGPAAVAGAGMLTQGFNTNLDLGLQSLRAVLPGIAIERLDVFQKLSDVALNPTDFGLSNAEAACVTPGVPPFHCQNADEYLFWDGIHPTAATHGIIAQEAARLLPH